MSSEDNPEWLDRFRSMQSPTLDIVSIDPDGNPIDDAVVGTLTWSSFRVGSINDGPKEGAIIVKFAPLGEMDPNQGMHLHMKVVRPEDALALWTQIMRSCLCDYLVTEIEATVIAHNHADHADTQEDD